MPTPAAPQRARLMAASDDLVAGVLDVGATRRVRVDVCEGGGGFYDDGLANGTYARRDEAYRDPPLDPPPAGSNDGDLDLATQLGMDNAFARQQRGQPDWRGGALGGGPTAKSAKPLSVKSTTTLCTPAASSSDSS